MTTQGAANTTVSKHTAGNEQRGNDQRGSATTSALDEGYTMRNYLEHVRKLYISLIYYLFHNIVESGRLVKYKFLSNVHVLPID